MTRKEIELALNELEGAYSLRLFLDNRTTVLAHDWSLVDGREGAGNAEGEAQREEDGRAGTSAYRDGECLLRVVVGRRQALIAVSRIVVIQKVPFGW